MPPYVGWTHNQCVIWQDNNSFGKSQTSHIGLICGPTEATNILRGILTAQNAPRQLEIQFLGIPHELHQVHFRALDCILGSTTTHRAPVQTMLCVSRNLPNQLHMQATKALALASHQEQLNERTLVIRLDYHSLHQERSPMLACSICMDAICHDLRQIHHTDTVYMQSERRRDGILARSRHLPSIVTTNWDDQRLGLARRTKQAIQQTFRSLICRLPQATCPWRTRCPPRQ
jgi:hypothetical protein